MSQAIDDPFDGLRLPVSAWKALEDACITDLRQLKALVPAIDQVASIGPETAEVIRDRLDRLSAKRRIRVRFIMPKRPIAKANGHLPVSAGEHLPNPKKKRLLKAGA